MSPKDLLDFPKMVFTLVWQLIYYTFTEVETFLLAITAALFGWQCGWEWGLVVFFAVYFAIRMIGGYVSMLANKLELLAQVMHRRSSPNE